MRKTAFEKRIKIGLTQKQSISLHNHNIWVKTLYIANYA
jgi:hypothetical protein